MKIGITGPVNIQQLYDLVHIRAEDLPSVISFPLTAHLARELHQKGVTVAVFALSLTVKNAVEYHGKGFSIYVVPGRHPYISVCDGFRSEIAQLEIAMSKAQCDVIHAHWHYEFALAAIKFTPNVLVTLHDAPLRIFRYLKAPFYYSFIKRLVIGRIVLCKAPFLTAVSPYLKEYYSENNPKRLDVKIIPNGVSDKLLSESKNISLNTSQITYANIGGYDNRKNTKIAVKAFIELQKRLPTAKMFVFGDFPKWYKHKNQNENLTFYGSIPQKQMVDILRNKVDILVQTTKEESFGMAILEAMAVGVPIIAGKESGAVPYLLENGKCGILTDIRNVEEVAESMYKLAMSPKERIQYSKNGQQRVRENFLISDVVDRYIDSYNSIIISNTKSDAVIQ